MARPTKQGVDYFPLDIHLDSKFKFVEIKYGLKGFAIIIKLLQKIYSNGYWFPFNEDEKLLFCHEINVDINLVNDVINEALTRDIFNINLYKQYEILTSKGIQKRYKEMVKRRKDVEVVEEYLLINGEFGVNVNIIKVNDNNNNTSSIVNDSKRTQSKVKETKVNKTKVNKTKKNSNVTVTLRNAIDKDKDKEEDKNNNIDQLVDLLSSNKIDFDAEFEILWKMYPRKIGKTKALQYYKKYRKTKNSSFEDVKEGIEKFNKYIKLNNIDTAFIPHGSTWFNQKRWDDELDLSKPIRFNKNKKVNPLPDWYDDYQKELEKQTNKKPKTKGNEGDIKKVKEMLGG